MPGQRIHAVGMNRLAQQIMNLRQAFDFTRKVMIVGAIERPVPTRVELPVVHGFLPTVRRSIGKAVPGEIHHALAIVHPGGV